MGESPGHALSTSKAAFFKASLPKAPPNRLRFRLSGFFVKKQTKNLQKMQKGSKK